MQGLGTGDPRWIGGYRLLGRLGEGGMGRVYLARSERGRTVAVKVVKAGLAQHPDFRRRFAQEIAAARRVGLGPQGCGGTGEGWTAPVLDADTTAAEPWVATGYIAGPSLAQVVDEDYGPLPEQSVQALATGLVRALSAIHAAGLVHRDLKPSNILLTLDGPRVIDFGIARAVDAALQSSGGLTSTGAIIGSPGFMSPEQVRGMPVTPASDIFCLGAVLAYAVTGRMPFGTADSGVHALMFRIAEEEADLSGLDGPLHELIAGCLAKEAAHRPTLETLAAHTRGEISGTWLPGEVLAQLGRHAVRLLDSEDPEAQAAAFDGAFGGAGRAAPPAPPTPPHPGFGGPYGYPHQAQQGHQAHRMPQGRQQHRPAAPSGYQPPSAYHTPLNMPPPPEPARTVRPCATVLWALLGAMLGWLVLDFVFNAMADQALSDSPEFYDPVYDSDYGRLKQATQVLHAIGLSLLLAVVTSWVLWFWRARLNAEAFRPGHLRFGPGMAVGSWFIPVGGLFLPKQIANDMWQASVSTATPEVWYGTHPPGARRGLLNAWWTTFVTFGVLALLTTEGPWYEGGSIDDAQGSLALCMCRDLVGVPAAILAIVVVIRLTRMQEDKITGRA